MNTHTFTPLRKLDDLAAFRVEISSLAGSHRAC